MDIYLSAYLSAYPNPKIFVCEPQYLFTNFVSGDIFVYWLSDVSRLSNITQKEFEIGMERGEIVNAQNQQPAVDEMFKKSISKTINEDENVINNKDLQY